MEDRGEKVVGGGFTVGASGDDDFGVGFQVFENVGVEFQGDATRDVASVAAKESQKEAGEFGDKNGERCHDLLD